MPVANCDGTNTSVLRCSSLTSCVAGWLVLAGASQVAKENDLAGLEALVARGADVNWANDRGTTALLMAVSCPLLPAHT